MKTLNCEDTELGGHCALRTVLQGHCTVRTQNPYYDKMRDIRSNISLCMREFPKATANGTLKGKGLQLTIYPRLSHNMDSITFLTIIMFIIPSTVSLDIEKGNLQQNIALGWR